MKVCVVDTGDGMTGDDMLKYINRLSSSGSEQSFTGNYGVDAKIAAATKNPAGVIYQSWRDGEGVMVQLERSSLTGNYSLRQWELKGGQYSYQLPLDDAVKPNELGSHGTKVILLGSKSGDNTMSPPADAASPSRWISKYLNTRYFQFPDGITVRAREGWDSPRSDKDRNLLRRLTGQKPYLEQHAFASGISPLDGARVHWWILKDEPALSNNSGYIESAGHVAALYQGELYDRATARAGTAILQRFGILFGHRYVVLYVEPLASAEQVLTTNTARTTLLLDGEKLPWDDWSLEFRTNLPELLAKFVSDKASAISEKDHTKNIKDRLKNVMDLYRVSRYRPAPAGTYLSDESSGMPVGPSPSSGSRQDASRATRMRGRPLAGKGPRDGEAGTVYHLFEKDGGVPSEKSDTDPFPLVKWVSVENGLRTADDGMEDKAASFIAGQNLLLINTDFRVFKDLVSRLSKDKTTVVGLDLSETVREIVHQWFEQSLVETVIGIQQLKGSKEWGSNEIEKALSPEALTSAVMQRYHVYMACRRELGARVGKLASTA